MRSILPNADDADGRRFSQMIPNCGRETEPGGNLNFVSCDSTPFEFVA